MIPQLFFILLRIKGAPLKMSTIRRIVPLAIVTFALSLTLACGKNTKHSVRPSSSPILSRTNPIIQGTPDESVGHHLTLKPEALQEGNYFLLSNNYTSYDDPIPWPLNSVIVTFKKRGDEILMFESLLGKSYASTVDNPLLARFPIVNETDDGSITFNFEKGIKIFLYQEGFYTTELAGEHQQRITYDISHSYVDSVTLKDTHISIAHSIRIRFDNGDTHPLSVRYALSSYTPSPTFKPSVTAPELQEKVGYFQSHPIVFPDHPYPTSVNLKYDLHKFSHHLLYPSFGSQGNIWGHARRRPVLEYGLRKDYFQGRGVARAYRPSGTKKKYPLLDATVPKY